MHGLATLSGERLLLRRWREEDRPAFAALNDDPQVMEFFPRRLTRAESDAMVDRIEDNFKKSGFGFWAVELRGGAPFIGFTGLAIPRFAGHFTPCVEIGWRLGFEHWGQGYATEAARLALDYAFRVAALPEIVSFTTATNLRSRAVMQRIGMRRDPADDFDHPNVDGPLRRHVLYRLRADEASRAAKA
jgi:ribosomal-protein-alanine N-acetyltransferase